MAEIMQASDAQHFLINDTSSAIKTMSIVETTIVSWLTVSELSNSFRSLIELAAYIWECPIKIDRGQQYFLHTSVRRSVFSNQELEPSSDTE